MNATVPMIPTEDSSMAPNDDGRFAPRPTPTPDVSPTRPSEKMSAVVRDTNETLPTFPFTTVSAPAARSPR